MFDMKGQIIIEKNSATEEDEIMMLALEAGAEDFATEDEYYEILTSPGDFSKVCDELEKVGLEFASAEITMLPATYTELTDPEAVEKMENLLNALRIMMMSRIYGITGARISGGNMEEEKENYVLMKYKN